MAFFQKRSEALVNFPGPRIATLRDGVGWLWQALCLLVYHPVPFVVAALLAPLGSALLLALPIWDALAIDGAWLAAVVTITCYGLPLTVAVSLATGLARAINQVRSLSMQQLLVPSILRVLIKCSLFLFGLLLQGYLAVYLIRDLVSPAAIMANFGGQEPLFPGSDTLLGTQLAVIGGLLLVLQLVFAGFVAPLYLFSERPLYGCWQLSFLAMRLNPWLSPALGLLGLLLVLLSYVKVFSPLLQLLALPLPIYVGALLYVAWREVFQGGTKEEFASPRKALA